MWGFLILESSAEEYEEMFQERLKQKHSDNEKNGIATKTIPFFDTELPSYPSFPYMKGTNSGFFLFCRWAGLAFINFYSKSQISQECHRFPPSRQNSDLKCHSFVTFESRERAAPGFHG